MQTKLMTIAIVAVLAATFVLGGTYSIQTADAQVSGNAGLSADLSSLLELPSIAAQAQVAIEGVLDAAANLQTGPR
jgi:hypothetical protein